MVEVAASRQQSPEPQTLDRPAAPPPRLRALDGLRLIAALLVVAFHFTARTSNAWDDKVQDVWPGVGA